MMINGVAIVDTFAEAFTMTAVRVIVTAASLEWAQIAANAATGYGASVIGCDTEAGIEPHWANSPDGRPAVSLLFFAFNRQSLEKAVVNRVAQCILTCPTTAVYSANGDSSKKIRIGGNLRYFGDGWQISKQIDRNQETVRFWRIPVMDGEFLCEDTFPTIRSVGGGNFIILGTTPGTALAAAEAAIAAIRQKVEGVIMPFPGGIVRSGSKVGSKYPKLIASTNDAFCPTLRGVVKSELPAETSEAYEIVIDGVSFDSVENAIRVGIVAACIPGVRQISAGNYGGKLGPHHFQLHKILEPEFRR